jgi:hypothetical protein
MAQTTLHHNRGNRMVREKPFLEINASGNYGVRVPHFVQAASASPGMSLPNQEKTIPIAQF